MALIKAEQTRAEGYGYYHSYGSDANDVLSYIESDLRDRLNEFRTDFDGNEFKVTVLVEKL